MTARHKILSLARGGWARGVLGNLATDLKDFGFVSTILLGSLAAGLARVSYITAPGTIGYLAAALAAVLLLIAAIDQRRFIIPDWLNAAALALAVAHAAAQESDAMVPAIAHALARGAVLGLLFFALRCGYARLRGQQGLGLGDVKLAFVAGAWLDWVTVPIAVELAALGALVAYLTRQYVLGLPVVAKARMPFGLFFAPAIWLSWVIQARWLGLP